MFCIGDCRVEREKQRRQTVGISSFPSGSPPVTLGSMTSGHERYLVEAYVRRSDASEARAAGRDARAAAEELSDEGTHVRYVRSTFLPNDETCFHVFEAVSEEAVREVCRRAGIGPGRIVRAVE
jgi:hypothetical protein